MPLKKRLREKDTIFPQSLGQSFYSARRGKRKQEWWRTSSLSVPYGLEGSGIILFLGKNTLKLAHAQTRWEEAIPFLHTPCLPIHLPLHTYWLTSLHMCAHTHLPIKFTHTHIHIKYNNETWYLQQIQTTTDKDHCFTRVMFWAVLSL